MNMSYCRFENTAGDLRDCLNHFEDELDTESEQTARKEIWQMACKIAEMDFSDEGDFNDDINF